MDVDDADFSVVEVANREGPTYSRAELEDTGWTVSTKETAGFAGC
jgi:hypothetical protein